MYHLIPSGGPDFSKFSEKWPDGIFICKTCDQMIRRHERRILPQSAQKSVEKNARSGNFSKSPPPGPGFFEIFRKVAAWNFYLQNWSPNDSPT